MQPHSTELSILEGDIEVKELSQYVQKNVKTFDAYEMEREIFAKVMKIGLSAMKCYFAEKGSGTFLTGCFKHCRAGSQFFRSSGILLGYLVHLNNSYIYLLNTLCLLF